MNETELKMAVKEFREIYQDEFGIALSEKEATERAIAMLNLFDILSTS